MRSVLFPLMAQRDDKAYASGSMNSIYTALSAYFNISEIGPFAVDKSYFKRVNNYLSRHGLPLPKYAIDHTKSVVNQYGFALSRAAMHVEYDFVFSTSSLLVASFSSPKPIYIYTDFSLASAIDYYPNWTGLWKSSRDEALEVEYRAFKSAKHIFLASEWACKDASDFFGLDRSKFLSVKRGANLISGWCTAACYAAIQRRFDIQKRNFLFVGVDWHRKGGDLAVAIVQVLRRRGFDVTLTVVGCSVPDNIANLDFVSCFSYQSRNSSQGASLLEDLFQKAFLFILPTLAEAMGIVFCEAASFALPVVAYRTGGVAEAVDDGVTGMLLHDADLGDLESFCERLEVLLTNREAYFSFSLSAFSKYERELNWPVIAKKISDVLALS